MRTRTLIPVLGVVVASLALAACSSSSSPSTAASTAAASAGVGGATTSAGTGGATTSSAVSSGTASGGGGAAPSATTGAGGGATTGAGGSGMGGAGGAPPTDTLSANRDRLLGTYFDYLSTSVVTPQSNGLSGSNVASVCDVWDKLDPSSRAVFLTLTARMQGSLLGDDGSSMLSHVVTLYRLTGGQNGNANDPGSCGGGEFNRMMMSMDVHLHDALVAAHAHQGAAQPDGKRDLADIPAASFWRDSHDLGGAHAPFDQSDETEQGAPRGQTQYFADPASAVAMAPLGRMDLMTLVDPLALEMDQDYDCVHSSNPSCSYVTYGPLCFPEPKALGTDIFAQGYGGFDPGWTPAGCGP